MADIKRSKDFFYARSGVFKHQTAHNVVQADADINTRDNLTNPSEPSTERQRETIYDCDGVHIVKEPITSQLDRWTINLRLTVQILLGYLAYWYGSAAAPTGTPADEVQTVTAATADGGAAPWTFNFRGITDTTAALAWNLSAANLKIALEALRSIGTGNIASITGSLTAGYVITFGGALAKANVPAFSIAAGYTASAAPVAANVVQTTAGANKYHLITKTVSDILAQFCFVTGYISDTSTYEKRKNAVVNRVKLTIVRTKGQAATLEIEIIASSDTVLNPTFTVPACITPDPIYAKDCRVIIDGAYLTSEFQELGYEWNNQIPIDDDTFAFDDINIQIQERGLQPTETFTLSVLGSKNDQIYKDARAELEKAVQILVGVPGERATISIPIMSNKLNAPAITYNPRGKSVINITGQPHKDPTLGCYSKVEGNIAQTTAFLTT